MSEQTFVVFANFMSAMPGKQDWDERSSALYAMAMSEWSDDVVKLVTKASATRFNFRPTPFELRTLALNLILDGFDLSRVVSEIKSIILHMPLHRRQSHLESLIKKDAKFNLVADVVKQSGGWLTIGSIQPEKFESVIQSALVSVLNSSKYELLLTKPTTEWVKHIGDSNGQKEKLLG